MSDGAPECGPLPAGAWHCAPWLPCTHPGGCLLGELTADPVVDRRQRAREAYWDARTDGNGMIAPDAVAEAIETATRVKLTPEVAEAFLAAPGDDPDDIWGPLRAAFRAAGFEVEE